MYLFENIFTFLNYFFNFLSFKTMPNYEVINDIEHNDIQHNDQYKEYKLLNQSIER